MEGTRDYRGLTYILESGDAVVYMKDLPKTIDDYGVVVHELFHAASWILRNIGIVQVEGSEECYAYVLEHLYNETVDWLNSLEKTNEQHE